jgi:hypothetical protein
MTFTNCTPINKIAEVEREVADAIAKVAYFISPKVVRRLAELNYHWQAEFEASYASRVSVANYFYNGSACVFPGVRRRANRDEKNYRCSNFTKISMRFSMITGFRVICGAFFAPASIIPVSAGRIPAWVNLNWLTSSPTKLLRWPVLKNGLLKLLLAIRYTAYLLVLQT